jgi:hypothetical protein
MRMSRSTIASGVLAGWLAANPATAETADTCRHGLAMADHLVQAVAAREKLFVPGDRVTNCQLLRQNLDDMAKAREPVARCLSGRERGETVAQIDASIADVGAAIADKCRK